MGNDTPQYAVQDAKLDSKTQAASMELAKHRWHWTLDESNPEKVAIREYARQVGRSESTIRKYAKAHELVRTSRTHLSIGDALELANMSVERSAAVKATAEASGKPLQSMRAGQNRTLVNDVLASARDRAERHGTTVSEEIPLVADLRARSDRAEKSVDDKRKERHTFRYIEIEGKIARAKRLLTEALGVFDGVHFDDEELDLLRDSIAKLRSLLDLIDLRAGGSGDIDWDVELTKLSNE